MKKRTGIPLTTKRNFFLLFLFSVLTLPACVKQVKKPAPVLPDATSTGAVTFGCRINGLVWVPWHTCSQRSMFSPDRSIPGLDSRMSHYRGDPSMGYDFQLTANLKRTETSQFLIRLTPYENHTGITHAGNIIDSLDIEYHPTDDGLAPIYHSHAHNAVDSFIVTKLDTVNLVISGRFSFTLYYENDNSTAFDTLAITDGRFDLKLTDYVRCDGIISPY